MDLRTIVQDVADYLQELDSSLPIHKSFRAGIGPFGEPQLIKAISLGLQGKGYICRTRQKPDLEIGIGDWAIEFKIVRPFGDNGLEAENWSVNLLHPYPGNTSSIGDAMKLQSLDDFRRKAVFVIGYEHEPAKISLDPLVASFEKISLDVIGIRLGHRIEETRTGLVHPEHQVVRCFAWEVC
jgi:hypothetical protein